MIVATACRVDDRKFAGFSFERDSRPSVARSWTLAVEERDLPDRVSATALLTSWLSEWFTDCVLLIP